MNGWDEFEGYMREARVRMEDRYAPIALLCLLVKPGTEGDTPEVMLYKDTAVVWPAEFPIAERGPLLARVAGPYRAGTVLRS